jgi:hypothetical protein
LINPSLRVIHLIDDSLGGIVERLIVPEKCAQPLRKRAALRFPRGVC